ncbi:hypothetical protein Tco_0838293 [Tanacetum coccineum]|uniref:Uncharacterized protein n=1 Tax=Tanacetum coccineum TaxID=301880 RepID=A0ABQ5AMD6_9ASTR
MGNEKLQCSRVLGKKVTATWLEYTPNDDGFLSTNRSLQSSSSHMALRRRFSLVSPHGMGDGDGDGDGGDHNVNDVIPVVDKIEELAQEYMEHLEHGKRTRIKKT